MKATAPGLVQRVELIEAQKVAQATPAVSRAKVADVRRVRVPAVLVREGAPPTPFLASGRFRSTWTGFLRMDLNSSRQLSLVGRGSAHLSVNGKALLEIADLETANMASAAIQLRGGLNQFELTYESPSVGDAELRVRWSGEGSLIEPIPATAFYHEAAQPELVRGEQMRAGRRLFHQRQCVKCHQPDAAQAAALTDELKAGAPVLDGVGARFSQAWLTSYLAAPQQSREDVLMPRVLHGSPEQISTDSRDVAAFLATLKGAVAPEGGLADASATVAGKALFQQLNCAACHTLAGDERLTDDTRLNLANVPAKWNAVALTAFLAKPSRNWSWTRMPDFKLTADEAGALGAFLLAQPHSQALALAAGAGDAVRGRELASQLGCVNCHALGGLETRFTAPSLAAIGNSDWQHGCVAADEASRGSAPDFGFTSAEVAALREFSHTDWLGALQRETAGEFAERHFTALRCNACHARDGIPDFASRLKANVAPAKSVGADEDEEGSGSVHLGRPDLTFAGEKLHGEWMQRLLAGRLGYRTRTEVQGRMPAFPAHGQMMGVGLAEQHGMTTDRGPAPRSDAALAAIGQRLTRVEGGFGCVSCHDVGQQRALAGKDTATINFAFVTDRLQPAYFWRYIRDPQRFRPGTMMPSFIAEDGSTPIKQVFDGDASRQFEAIWQYLMSLTPADAAVTP